ncbi:hypothetical protein COO55_41030 [Rhodococcus opacus]|nr:hypothetical protein COO55_41030 [Rhodococcus opacus]
MPGREVEHRDDAGEEGALIPRACLSCGAELLLLGVLDGPPGGRYVEGREDRPWVDPALLGTGRG